MGSTVLSTHRMDAIQEDAVIPQRLPHPIPGCDPREDRTGRKSVARFDGLEIGICDLRVVHVVDAASPRAKISRYLPLLRRQLAGDPENFYCWWHLGECLRLSGDNEGASDAWLAGISRLRDIPPERRKLRDSILYLSLIQLQHECGESTEALVTQAISDFPGHLTLQWFTARLAVERGDLDAAQPVLEKLMAIDADTFFEPQLAYDKALFHHLPAQTLALCHFRRGRFDEAARLYRVAAKTAPDPNACNVKARLAELRRTAGCATPSRAGEYRLTASGFD